MTQMTQMTDFPITVPTRARTWGNLGFRHFRHLRHGRDLFKDTSMHHEQFHKGRCLSNPLPLSNDPCPMLTPPSPGRAPVRRAHDANTRSDARTTGKHEKTQQARSCEG